MVSVREGTIKKNSKGAIENERLGDGDERWSKNYSKIQIWIRRERRFTRKEGKSERKKEKVLAREGKMKKSNKCDWKWDIRRND